MPSERSASGSRPRMQARGAGRHAVAGRRPLRSVRGDRDSGHAPDHLSFISGPVAFTGDAVLGEGSVFVYPYPGALAAYLDGLARLRQRELVLCSQATVRRSTSRRRSSSSTSRIGSSASAGCSPPSTPESGRLTSCSTTSGTTLRARFARPPRGRSRRTWTSSRRREGCRTASNALVHLSSGGRRGQPSPRELIAAVSGVALIDSASSKIRREVPAMPRTRRPAAAARYPPSSSAMLIRPPALTTNSGATGSLRGQHVCDPVVGELVVRCAGDDPAPQARQPCSSTGPERARREDLDVGLRGPFGRDPASAELLGQRAAGGGHPRPSASRRPVQRLASR